MRGKNRRAICQESRNNRQTVSIAAIQRPTFRKRKLAVESKAIPATDRLSKESGESLHSGQLTDQNRKAGLLRLFYSAYTTSSRMPTFCSGFVIGITIVARI